MDLLEKLSRCQKILYQGFVSREISGLPWLDTFCKDFHSFCNHIHKFLLFDCTRAPVIVENCFLCLTQVICCIRFLEKVLRLEHANGIVLAPTRQYFLDRILWCIARMKSCISSIDDDIISIESVMENNFVNSLDIALDLIGPYNTYEKAQISNFAEHKAEAMFESQKLRESIELLVGQSLAFSNVALPEDQKPISALCQKVLRECMSFQDECSLIQTEYDRNFNSMQLKAGTLEQGIFQLEDVVNESLLKLVFRLLVDLSKPSISKLRTLIASNASENILDKNLCEFDLTLDRILQVGIFAVVFAPNAKVKTSVQSCLASLESLDANLIASLYSHCEIHSAVLEDHYNSEIKLFRSAIQEIIDTNAFCNSYREILGNTVKHCEKSFDKNLIADVLEMGKVLYEHFTVNKAELDLIENPVKKQKFKEFGIMMNECLAILACADQVDVSRIIKRLNIFKSVVKKLQHQLDLKPADNKVERLHIKNDSLGVDKTESCGVEPEKMFETFGIRPHVTSILYKTKNETDITDSLRGNSSKATSQGSRTSQVKKRVSLRIAMFKRQKSDETKVIWNAYNEQSTNLHITDILDQITDLSSTFLKPGFKATLV